MLTIGEDKKVRLWNVADRRQLLPWSGGQTATASNAQFSPDGKIVLTIGLDNKGLDNTVRLSMWDENRELPRPDGQAAKVSGARFSRDGKTVLTIGLDSTARLWNLDQARD